MENNFLRDQLLAADASQDPEYITTTLFHDTNALMDEPAVGILGGYPQMDTD